MKRSLLTAALLLTTFFTLATSAHADSLVLQSTTPSGSNTLYQYGLDIDPSSAITFDDGEGITLTGLSGVNNATALLPNFTATFTPTSVSITSTVPSNNFVNFNFAIDITDAILVSSTSSTVGTVDYAIAFGGATILGEVDGPVAPSPVPEPSTLLLLGTGILALAQTTRRKFHT